MEYKDVKVKMRLVLCRPWRFVEVGTRAEVTRKTDKGFRLKIDGDFLTLLPHGVACWEPDWVRPRVGVRFIFDALDAKAGDFARVHGVNPHVVMVRVVRTQSFMALDWKEFSRCVRKEADSPHNSAYDYLGE